MTASQPKILLLEDHDLMREELVDILSDDYDVCSAANATDGIQMAQFEKFDLLVTDVRMPGPVDGVGAVEGIKKVQPKLYSIIITGFTDEEAPSRAMRHGVDFFLYKPFGPQKLLNAVEQVLSLRREHSTYQGQLAQFFQGSRRFLSALAGQHLDQEESLDASRLNFFKAYASGMQAGNLTRNGALSLWDRLIVLEETYEQLQQVAGPEADQLASKYRLLREEAEDMARKRSLGDGKPREPGQIVMANFSKLYDRVSQGQLGVPILMTAPVLWWRSAGRQPSGEMGQLWARLFR